MKSSTKCLIMSAMFIVGYIAVGFIFELQDALLMCAVMSLCAGHICKAVEEKQ